LIVSWLNGFSIRPNRPAGARPAALHHQVLADVGLGDDELVDVEAVVVLGVGDRRLQRLLDVVADRFFEKVRSASAFSTFLLRIIAATRLSLRGLVRIIRFTAIASLSATRRGFFSLPMAYLRFAFLSAAWP
jgi:hypothetical protein